MVALPSSIAHAYGLVGEATRFGTGLINDTFQVQRGAETLIVQRVHPIFGASVHEDIEAVTNHLARKEIVTPRLLRTLDGALFSLDEEGRVWRALTFIDGTSYDRFPSIAHAREAGALVGRFHAALQDFDHTYVFARGGVHDISFRENGLEQPLATHPGHRLRAEVLTLIDATRRLLGRAVRLGTQRPRHAHGDLKASNLLFRGQAALALVDLDTMASMMWIFEMGDALRSWCNPCVEEDPSSRIDIPAFEAALSGYASTGPRVTSDERATLARGVLTISLELALRFLTDTLNETYFGFDPTRYPARGEHNLARARAQVAFAESVERELPRLEKIARSVLLTS